MAVAKLDIPLWVMIPLGILVAAGVFMYLKKKQPYVAGNVYADKATADLFASQDAAFK